MTLRSLQMLWLPLRIWLTSLLVDWLTGGLLTNKPVNQPHPCVPNGSRRTRLPINQSTSQLFNYTILHFFHILQFLDEAVGDVYGKFAAHHFEFDGSVFVGAQHA